MGKLKGKITFKEKNREKKEEKSHLGKKWEKKEKKNHI